MLGAMPKTHRTAIKVLAGTMVLSEAWHTLPTIVARIWFLEVGLRSSTVRDCL